MKPTFATFKAAGEALAAEAACSPEIAFIAIRLGTESVRGRAFVEHITAAAGRLGVRLGVKR